MKNMVAVGATCAVLNLDINVFEEVVQEIFGKKGQQVVAKNMEAIKAGYDYLKEQITENSKLMELEKADGKNVCL